MKTLSSIVTTLVVAAVLASSAVAHVTLRTPTGGESFVAGTTIDIRWSLDIAHNQLNWDLYFSPNGGATWQVIQLDMQVSQLSRRWTLPAMETTNARVRIVQDNVGGDYEAVSGEFTVTGLATGIAESEELPRSAGLLGAYPNPFASRTQIELKVAREDHVRVQVLDLQGRVVAVLTDRFLLPGPHLVQWDGSDQPNGVYLVQLSTGSLSETRTVMLLR